MSGFVKTCMTVIGTGALIFASATTVAAQEQTSGKEQTKSQVASQNQNQAKNGQQLGAGQGRRQDPDQGCRHQDLQGEDRRRWIGRLQRAHAVQGARPQRYRIRKLLRLGFRPWRFRLPPFRRRQPTIDGFLLPSPAQHGRGSFSKTPAV